MCKLPLALAHSPLVFIGTLDSISMVGILGDASIILGPWETITAAIVGLYTNLYVNPVVPGDQDLNAV